MWAQPGSTRDKATTTPFPRDSHRHSGRRNHHQVHHHHHHHQVGHLYHHATTTTTTHHPPLPSGPIYGRPRASISCRRCSPVEVPLPTSSHPPSKVAFPHPSPSPPHHPPSSLHPLLTARPPACEISHLFIPRLFHPALLRLPSSIPPPLPTPTPTPTPTPHHYTPPPPPTPHPPSPTPRHRASKHLTPLFSQAMLLWYAMGAIGRPLKCDSSWWRED